MVILKLHVDILDGVFDISIVAFPKSFQSTFARECVNVKVFMPKQPNLSFDNL